MAGTVTTSENIAARPNSVIFDWESDASGNATATTTEKYDGVILAAEFDPYSTAVENDYSFSASLEGWSAHSVKYNDDVGSTAYSALYDGHSGSPGVAFVTSSRTTTTAQARQQGLKLDITGTASASTSLSAWCYVEAFTAQGGAPNGCQFATEIEYDDLTTDRVFTAIEGAVGAWTQVTTTTQAGNYGKSIIRIYLYVIVDSDSDGTYRISDAVFSNVEGPLDNYDAVITDSDGIDVLAGAGANLDNAGLVGEFEGMGGVATSALSLAISNAGDTRRGAVKVVIR